MPPQGRRQRLIARLRQTRAGNGLLLAYQCLRGGETRRVALLRLSRPQNLFQPYGTTAPDRYPELFTFVRQRIGDGPHRRILSFGCADGDEVFSLRRYFPQASIKGLDIDPRRIRRARARLSQCGGDAGTSFDVAGSASRERRESYHAVLAMAVFRHGDLGDAPPRCDHLIDFSDFERSVAELADCLVPGGLLVLRHSNFRLGDTSIAGRFLRVIDAAEDGGGNDTPIYGRDNFLLPGFRADDGVFEKL